LTLFAPIWVEKGALPAVREDSVPNSPEKLEELLQSLYGDSWSKILWIFSGHGTEPHNIRRLDACLLKEALASWRIWREWATNHGTPPSSDTEEGRIARRATRDAWDCLTAGEALVGLPMRSGGAESQLGITYDPAKEGYWPESWDWSILVEGLGRAVGSSEVEGKEPGCFRFEPCSRSDSWGYTEDGKEWKVRRTFHVFRKEDGEMQAEYRWHRWYEAPLEEGEVYAKYVAEYMVTEDLDHDQTWGTERPW
jgi:hypothetical protein